ncbi:MAG: DEAD/DEAH box helicase family protein [Gammaproteobacteria bacterium]|nr:DEAD/DEAH box helicase family protein [Gammaproteobacteria bacterium]
MNKTIPKLIINSPYTEPEQHWFYDRETREFRIENTRRRAGYILATPDSNAFDDPGIPIEIALVNQIRPRVKAWRQSGYPGVTGITKRLLEHWHDKQERRDNRFFFCQIEAIETLIWLTEAPTTDRTGIAIEGDGGQFERWCSKMATGSGKTVIMAMLIAWNFLNKITNPADTRFSRNVLVVAPGLTVKNRLQVLLPAHSENYYEVFNIVPTSLMDKLRQGKVLVRNWHELAWDTQEKLDSKIKRGQLRSVDKRKHTEISGEAYARQVLGEMANARNILVINDEAHHAWRINPRASGKYKRTGSSKDSAEEATVWVGGLDRIHAQRGILRCYDLSATPFSPSGKKSAEETLFNWIVSDFGLNDAIESGLVKTPRVVVRDDSTPNRELKSRLYHIYADEEVKDDINRKAKETDPLPDLLLNAYYLLGQDWELTRNEWLEQGHPVPPVMITVANRIETSARIKYAFDHKKILIPELCDTDKTLQIDSKVLSEAESEIEPVNIGGIRSNDGMRAKPKLTRKQRAEQLRQMVDTVGRIGEPGEKIHNIISVGMLSEGWDAKTVTHIMGVRAFSSQLLCEQVVGRGLRRISYDMNDEELFEPEYVNIFGVPFTFLPHEGNGSVPAPPKPKTRIEPVREKLAHEIVWPNILRIDHQYQSHLTLDWDKVQPLEIDPYDYITKAELAAMVDGKPNNIVRAGIDLREKGRNTRIQTVAFNVASTIYNSETPKWKGHKELFLLQLIRLTEQFLNSGKITIKNNLPHPSDTERKILLILNMNKIIHHFWSEIRSENTEKLVPVFDKENPVRSTSDMRAWFTSKPCEWLEKSHISHCVYDSNWEATEAFFMEKSEWIVSFAKNDHLGFYVLYNYKGVIRKYYPDFLVKLANGDSMVLEVKGQDDPKNQAKRRYLNEWIKAVNGQGGFGQWHFIVSFHPSDLKNKIRDCIEHPSLPDIK